MDASSIDESKFTHVHFAFAGITDNFEVDVSKVQAQFNKFKALKAAKKIVALGPTTFHVFRTCGSYQPQPPHFRQVTSSY
jgi:GH18 family chitinase